MGNILLRTDSRRVLIEGTEIELKNKEYELLAFLMSNPDIVFSKETLYEWIWGYDAMGDNATVAVHINRLRKKWNTIRPNRASFRPFGALVTVLCRALPSREEKGDENHESLHKTVVRYFFVFREHIRIKNPDFSAHAILYAYFVGS